MHHENSRNSQTQRMQKGHEKSVLNIGTVLVGTVLEGSTLPSRWKTALMRMLRLSSSCFGGILQQTQLHIGLEYSLQRFYSYIQAWNIHYSVSTARCVFEMSETLRRNSCHAAKENGGKEIVLRSSGQCVLFKLLLLKLRNNFIFLYSLNLYTDLLLSQKSRRTRVE